MSTDGTKLVRSRNSKIRLWSTLKLLFGVLFLAGTLWLAYWLVIVREVRNVAALIAIAVFLGIPSICAIAQIPFELLGLIQVWTSENPGEVDKSLSEMRDEMNS